MLIAFNGMLKSKQRPKSVHLSRFFCLLTPYTAPIPAIPFCLSPLDLYRVNNLFLFYFVYVAIAVAVAVTVAAAAVVESQVAPR